MQKSEMGCKLTPGSLGIVRIYQGLIIQASSTLLFRQANSTDVGFFLEKGLRAIRGGIAKQIQAFSADRWVRMFSVERIHRQSCICSI